MNGVGLWAFIRKQILAKPKSKIAISATITASPSHHTSLYRQRWYDVCVCLSVCEWRSSWGGFRFLERVCPTSVDWTFIGWFSRLASSKWEKSIHGRMTKSNRNSARIAFIRRWATEKNVTRRAPGVGVIEFCSPFATSLLRLSSQDLTRTRIAHQVVPQKGTAWTVSPSPLPNYDRGLRCCGLVFIVIVRWSMLAHWWNWTEESKIQSNIREVSRRRRKKTDQTLVLEKIPTGQSSDGIEAGWLNHLKQRVTIHGRDRGGAANKTSRGEWNFHNFSISPKASPLPRFLRAIGAGGESLPLALEVII